MLLFDNKIFQVALYLRVFLKPSAQVLPLDLGIVHAH